MRQIAQNYKTGEVKLVDVPVPACRPGGVVVRSEYSLVSAGTELMKIAESKMSLLGKARARPDQVRKVLESVSQQGVGATYRKVMNRLDSYTPLGYSLAGTVVESMVPELPVGSRVACGGNEYALHAEFNYVPRNLCALVPDGVKAEHAAFATVGAIAMQEFRRSEATIGETVCVIGLGLIGQLLVQIADAAGVNVVGLDPSEERCGLAERSGARAAGAPEGSSASRVRERLLDLTDGHGADVVFLAAATDSNQPVSTAVEIARDKARIVDVGKMPLDLPWKPYYEKEIDVRFSRSYGPGRYDPRYEEEGFDYPIGYVRWTEQRNMRSFLELVGAGKIQLESLVDEIIPFDSSVEAYERLLSGESRAIGSLFGYPQETSIERVLHLGKQADIAPRTGKVGVGVIGSGNYASTMLLPHLASNPDVHLAAVATATALSGATAQQRFGFDRITSDYRTLIDDGAIDAVIIATRHDLHASMVS
ncbi:MAG TPA: zinc-binding dehydrogenase, partial [Acidimicrobiia bacterium]|nr:zinc-binding dehydrogenase [Acidimicrobiia bacterium]